MRPPAPARSVLPPGGRAATLRSARRAAPLRRGFGDTLKKLGKQIQGQLPVIGLFTRLTTPGGGIGSDELVRGAEAGVVLLWIYVFPSLPLGFRLPILLSPSQLSPSQPLPPSAVTVRRVRPEH